MNLFGLPFSNHICRVIVVILFLLFLFSFVFFPFLFFNYRFSPERESKFLNNVNFPSPSSKLVHLSWFVQVTDIHVSQFDDENRVSQLREFCSSVVHVIQPALVIVTGDLTDAKTRDKTGSQQYEDEWDTYSKIIKKCSSVLLDLRGNHDSFNVPGVESENNFFRKYSAQGSYHPRSYHYQYHSPYGENYSFIALDASPVPGPRRPFNFIGQISEKEYANLEKLSEEASSSNAVIWFGHYPSSFIVSPSPGVRSLMRYASAYLCGHLHTLYGLVHKMYTMQPTGMLELELGDWKDHRRYRVMAFDHGHFSFTDVKFGNNGPVVLITLPKNPQFHIPMHESYDTIEKSSHIRMLVFDNQSIESVKVFVDGVVMGEALHEEGPLYVLPWNPRLYNVGLHHIKVVVNDASGRTQTVEQPFSLSPQEYSFGMLANFILLSDFPSIGRMLFFVAVGGIVLICFIFRRLTHKGFTYRLLLGHDTKPRWITCLLHGIRGIFRVDQFYLCILGSTIYTAVGPWFLAELIDGEIGIVFAWGMFVHRTVMHADINFIFGVTHLATFQLSLILYLSLCCIYRIRRSLHVDTNLNWQNRLLLAFKEFVFLTIVGSQCYGLYSFFISYDVISLVNPLKLGSIFLACYLRYRVGTIAPEKFGPVTAGADLRRDI